MLQRLLNSSTEQRVDEWIDDLDRLERAWFASGDAASWAKSTCYVEGIERFANDEEFEGLKSQRLIRAINKRLQAQANQRGKRLPRPSFRANALKLHQTWPEIFTVDSKLLPYSHYSYIAVCSLPREEKERLRADAERTYAKTKGDQPTQDALRKTIREAVDAYNGVYKPDFELKVTNFWKFSSPHDNDGYGGVHLEVIANLVYWFTDPGDIIIDPMAGTGVLAKTLMNYKFFKNGHRAEGAGPRIGLMSDLEPKYPQIAQADAAVELPFDKNSAELAILDPPYFRIADDKQYQNLSHKLDEWLATMALIVANVMPCMVPGGAIAIITDDVLRKNEHVPMALRISRIIEDAGLLPCATIYNHTPNFLCSMGPAQMKAARDARLYVNNCKVIQIARVPHLEAKIRGAYDTS